MRRLSLEEVRPSTDVQLIHRGDAAPSCTRSRARGRYQTSRGPTSPGPHVTLILVLTSLGPYVTLMLTSLGPYVILAWQDLVKRSFDKQLKPEEYSSE